MKKRITVNISFFKEVCEEVMRCHHTEDVEYNGTAAKDQCTCELCCEIREKLGVV